MPNYVRGKLQISGENVKGLIDSLCVTDKDGYKRFDFNKIVPMPDDLKICCGGPTERCMLLFINSLATGFSSYTKYVKAYVTYKRGQRRLPHEKEPQIDIKVSDFEKRRMINDLLNSYSEKQPCFEENPVFKTEEDIYAYGKHALDNYLVYGYLDWYDWSIGDDYVYDEKEGTYIYREDA